MKALCVFSGGLDSMLAAGLIRGQGIDVLALFFETPFFASKRARKSARSLDLSLKVVDITGRHLEVVKRPKYGYGGNMNPCIDCHALMFRVAGEMLEAEMAAFVITGEVLGQRPMSQNKKALSLVNTQSGLGRLLLRPLSAKHLPITIPEEEGWVKREFLMDFQGRSRKPQIELAKTMNVEEYPSPAGGCLLTEKVFSERLRDLLSSQQDPQVREIELLKVGRHFRIGPNSKIVVGRNKKENEVISRLSRDGDFVIRSVSVPGPTALLLGEASDDSIDLASSITAAYSDVGKGEVSEVRIMGKTGEDIRSVRVSEKGEFKQYMINS
ncbi:MAG: tRNA 4-thiouridine(8) synthase ThiI [Pseudomonadota bacterium]